MKNSNGNILIVDDTQLNLQLLVKLLSQHGYTVRPTLSGKQALASVQVRLPDLILLDIMMPEMDGYEVCRQLKADERTSHIPVIFISALNDELDKVTAFSVGGVDYITKPFHKLEVLARVQTHISLHQTQQALKQRNNELDAYAHTVAHDLKNPLGSIISYTEILQQDAAMMTPEELQLIGQATQQSAQKAFDIVNDLLLLASVRKEQVEVVPLDMDQIISQAQERLQGMIREYQGEIIVPECWPNSLGYAPWIEEVWINYLSNGLKYGGSPPRLEVGITPQTEDMLLFWVKDNGAGLALEDQNNLFSEFTRLSEVWVEGHGLGLAITRRIVHKLGGQTGLKSRPGHGSLFYFTLPAANKNGV